MDIEELRNYCLSKPGATESTPFGEDTLVLKVGKMFALFSMSNFVSINLKCDPEKAIELREEYGAVKPGWHMNKKHWNTVMFHEDLDDDKIMEMVDHSYNLVVKSLSKKVREELNVS